MVDQEPLAKSVSCCKFSQMEEAVQEPLRYQQADHEAILPRSSCGGLAVHDQPCVSVIWWWSTFFEILHALLLQVDVKELQE